MTLSSESRPIVFKLIVAYTDLMEVQRPDRSVARVRVSCGCSAVPLDLSLQPPSCFGDINSILDSCQDQMFHMDAHLRPLTVQTPRRSTIVPAFPCVALISCEKLLEIAGNCPSCVWHRCSQVLWSECAMSSCLRSSWDSNAGADSSMLHGSGTSREKFGRISEDAKKCIVQTAAQSEMQTPPEHPTQDLHALLADLAAHAGTACQYLHACRLLAHPCNAFSGCLKHVGPPWSISKVYASISLTTRTTMFC